MLKKITYLFISVLIIFESFYCNSFSLAQEKETSIIIIGTVHYETEKFKSDTLLKIFNRIKPDLILVECDTSYMTKDFRLKEDVQYEFLETSAITKYLKENNVLLRPYDINGRDEYLDGYERKNNEVNFFSDVDMLSESNKLKKSAVELLDKIKSMMNISDEMSNASASFINSTVGIQKIDTINYFTYLGFEKLIKMVPELSQYTEYWKNEISFWNKRNQYMTNNIIRYKRKFEGMKIIVLCGFAHMNILKSGISKKASEENIRLRDYREY